MEPSAIAACDALRNVDWTLNLETARMNQLLSPCEISTPIRRQFARLTDRLNADLVARRLLGSARDIALGWTTVIWTATIWIAAGWMVTGPTSVAVMAAETEQAAAAVTRPDPARWAADMEAFAAADRAAETPAGGIVFVGSSSIRMWDLATSFPQLKPLNRGFGGSHLAETVHYFDLLVARHRPRAIVVYAGDNDIADQLTPQQVLADFEQLHQKLHDHLPACHLFFIAIKPSVARWEIYPAMRETNALIAAACETSDQLHFVDIAPPMLNASGRPRPELFADDGLHLNAAGYAIWTKIVAAELDRAHLLQAPIPR